MPNKMFAWFEYFTSLVKIFVFLLLIVLSLALVLGAGPNGFVHHGDTWTRLPPFLNGFTVSCRTSKTKEIITVRLSVQMEHEADG